MRAFGPAVFPKWMPRGDLLTIDLAAFGKWMLTLAASIFVVGAASTGTLNLISNYVVRPATTAVPAQSPAALRSVEPIQLVSPAAEEEAEPAATATAAITLSPGASTTLATPSTLATAAVPVEPKMMATLSLAVRSHPRKESAQVGALQQGEIVAVQGANHGWYLVTTSDGVSGWSWGKYLDPVGPQVATDSPFWAAQSEEVAFAR